MKGPCVKELNYRPDIDGLRAIAVLSVVCFHAFPHLVRGGFVGVDIFFVISGFLISTILIDGLENNSLNLVEFYQRRIKRIFPALILVLTFCLAFGWIALLPNEYKQLGSHVAGGAGFISNFLLWNNIGYFDTAADTKPLLHLWSLGIEEQFYIIWPVLLWFVWKKKFNPLTVIIGISLISFALNFKGIKVNASATFYSPLTRFWELLCGSLLAYLIYYKTTAFNHLIRKIDFFLIKIIYKETHENDGNTLRNVLSILGLFIIGFSIVRLNKEIAFPGAWALFPTIGALLIILSGAQAWVNRVILSRNLLVWFGLISYPLYLWHWPLLSFARIMEENYPHRAIRISIVAISILLAWLTYRFIERPIRGAKSLKKSSALLASLMSIAACMGLYIHHVKGFDFRYKSNLAISSILANPVTYEKNLFKCAENIPFFKQFFLDFCFLSKKKKAPEILFLGDSHALHYLNAAWKHFQSKSIIMIVRTSCLPFSNDSLFQGSCRDTYNAVISYVNSNPSIKKVYLSGYWSYLMTGNIGETGPSWRHAVPLDIERDKSFIQNGRDLIEKLVQANKEIIFLKDIPDLDFNINSCFDTRPLRLSKAKLNKDCAIDFAKYKKRTIAYNQILEEVLKGFPQVKIYDPQSLFCKGLKCLARDKDLPFYSNGDHLNYYGANLVIKDMLKQTKTRVS